MVVGEVREALLGNLPWSDLRGKIEYAINLSTDISRIFKYEREHTDEKNNSLYEKYKKLADNDDKVIFGGRLGQYKYYDMDKVIEEALNLCKKIL